MGNYVNGLGVHQIAAIEPPGNWRDITGRASNLPSFLNDATGEKIRVAVGSQSAGAFVVFQHNVGAPHGLSNPLTVASTDGEAAAFLRSYMAEHDDEPGHK